MKEYAVYCTGLTPEKGICKLTATFEENVAAWQVYGIPNPRLVTYDRGQTLLDVDFKADTIEDLDKATAWIIETLQSFGPKIGDAVYLVDQLRPSYSYMAFVRIK